jgi:hypothetical protein
MIDWLRARWRGALVVATAVVVTSALVAGGVLAQTPTPTPSKPGATQKPGVAAKPDAAIESFFDKLAGRLGVPADKVKTEAKNVQKEMIDEAVAAGRITKEVGDRLKQRVDAGAFVLPHTLRPPVKPRPGGRPGPALAGLRDGFEAVARCLGITPAQLRQELPGKSLAQVAAAHNKPLDAFKTCLTDEAKKRLDQAVQDKRLTQEQANQMLARFTQNLDTMINRVFPAGPGPRGNRPGAPKPPAKPGGGA